MVSDTGFVTKVKAFAKIARQKNFPWKVFYRHIAVQAAIIIVGLGTAGVVARYYFKRQFISQVASQAQDTIRHQTQNIIDTTDNNWCRSQSAGGEVYLSLLRANGNLVCDSLEIHSGDSGYAELPEVKEAQLGRFGKQVRYHLSLHEDVFYGALLVKENWILRVAVPLRRLSEMMAILDATMTIVFLVISFSFLGVAYMTAQRLVFPLGRMILKSQGGDGNGNLALDEEYGHETAHEWLELESNIETLRKDLVAKTQILSLEQVELDTIMAAISDAILALDPNGTPLFFNSRFEVLFGGEDLRKPGTKLWTLFRDPEVLEAFNRALHEGAVGLTKAVPLDQRQGGRRYFSISVSPLRKQDGTIYGAIGVFHDVTELKSAEQMRIDFVANVSHELRTPLTSIKGYVDTLIEDVSKKRQVDAEFLQVIARNTERLLNLMNDLLDLSSLETEEMFHKDSVDVKELTDRIVSQFQEAVANKKQTIEMDLKAERVYADPHRVEQALTNLIDNANKYALEGGKIVVAWREDGLDTILSVWNDGPEIPIEHHPRLFERFYRVDRARSRAQGGTGLGLAIVKHILQKHEGSIAIESGRGQGTKFICRFPGL